MSNSSVSTAADTFVADKPTKQRLYLLLVLFLTIFISYLDRVSVSVLAANAEFLAEMGIKGQPVQIGLMMSIFLISYGLANFSLGALGDYFGPRKVMIGAILLWCVALAVGGLAGTFAVFLAGRVLLGIGEGVHHPMQNSFVKNWFPRQERARANTCWVLGQALAPAVAMPFFAYTIIHLGWRASFLICLLLGLIPLVMLWHSVTDKPKDNKRVNALELEHIQAGLEPEAPPAPDGPKESFFTRMRPVVTNFHYWLLVIWYICIQWIYWGLLTWLPSYLKEARGFSWEAMGWLASLPFILNVIIKIPVGWLADKIGRLGPFLMAAVLGGGVLIYLTATVQSNYLSAILLAFGVGVGMMAVPIAWTLLQSLVPARLVATSAGMMNGIATGSASLSPLIIGAFIKLNGSYDSGLFLLVGFCALAFVAAAALTALKH